MTASLEATTPHEADGKVTRVVRCACGAGETTMRVHPATHTGYSCAECMKPDGVDCYVRSVAVVRYPGSDSEARFEVRTFRQNDGRFAVTIRETSAARTWDGRPRTPFSFASHGLPSCEGAYVLGTLVAAGESWLGLAGDAQRAVDARLSAVRP